MYQDEELGRRILLKERLLGTPLVDGNATGTNTNSLLERLWKMLYEENKELYARLETYDGLNVSMIGSIDWGRKLKALPVDQLNENNIEITHDISPLIDQGWLLNGEHTIRPSHIASVVCAIPYHPFLFMKAKETTDLKEADDKQPCNYSIGEKLAIYGYCILLQTILINNIVNGFATVEGNGQRIPHALARDWKSEAGRKTRGKAPFCSFLKEGLLVYQVPSLGC